MTQEVKPKFKKGDRVLAAMVVGDVQGFPVVAPVKGTILVSRPKTKRQWIIKRSTYTTTEYAVELGRDGNSGIKWAEEKDIVKI